MPAPETKSFVLISEDQGFGVEHHLCVCPGHSCANRNFGMSSSNVCLYQKTPPTNILLNLTRVLNSPVKMNIQHTNSR